MGWLVQLLIALLVFIVLGSVLAYAGVPLAWIIALVVAVIVFFGAPAVTTRGRRQ